MFTIAICVRVNMVIYFTLRVKANITNQTITLDENKKSESKIYLPFKHD